MYLPKLCDIPYLKIWAHLRSIPFGSFEKCQLSILTVRCYVCNSCKYQTGETGSGTITTGLSRTCTEFMHQSDTGCTVPGTRAAKLGICLIYGRIYVYSVWKAVCFLETINLTSEKSM